MIMVGDLMVSFFFWRQNHCSRVTNDLHSSRCGWKPGTPTVRGQERLDDFTTFVDPATALAPKGGRRPVIRSSKNRRDWFCRSILSSRKLTEPSQVITFNRSINYKQPFSVAISQITRDLQSVAWTPISCSRWPLQGPYIEATLSCQQSSSWHIAHLGEVKV